MCSDINTILLHTSCSIEQNTQIRNSKKVWHQPWMHPQSTCSLLRTMQSWEQSGDLQYPTREYDCTRLSLSEMLKKKQKQSSCQLQSFQWACIINPCITAKQNKSNQTKSMKTNKTPDDRKLAKTVVWAIHTCYSIITTFASFFSHGSLQGTVYCAVYSHYGINKNRGYHSSELPFTGLMQFGSEIYLESAKTLLQVAVHTPQLEWAEHTILDWRRLWSKTTATKEKSTGGGQ